MKTEVVAEQPKERAGVPGKSGAFPFSAFLRHPASVVLSTVSVAAPLAAPLAWRFSPAAALGGMVAAHGALCYASLRANCQWFGPVATRFEPKGNEVWLTIDDGPTPEDTPRMLDLLDAAGARATFFVRGDCAEANPELIREIVSRGHGVANHTYHHPQYSFWCASPWRIAGEMDRCSAVLRGLTGQAPRWFRAPVGMVNPFVHPAASVRGLRLIGWSVRGLDTLAGASPDHVVRRILRNLRPGGIVLLHEGRQDAAGGRINVQALRLLLTALGERGWRATVPDDAQLR